MSYNKQRATEMVARMSERQKDYVASMVLAVVQEMCLGDPTSDLPQETRERVLLWHQANKVDFVFKRSA